MTDDYYDDYFFTTKGGDFMCPNIPFACNPLSACARDPTTGTRYCCSNTNAACWRGSTKCASDGSTQDCGNGSTAWCCKADTEICTQAKGQINVCWNKTPSTMYNISADVLGKEFTSLSSASSGASTYAFTPFSLIQQTRTTSASSSTQTMPASSSASTTSSGPSSSPTLGNPTSHSTSSHLSGGAIAGITIGAVAVVAVIIAAIFYFLRNHRKNREAQAAQNAVVYGNLQNQQKDQSFYRPELPGAAASPAASELPSGMYRTHAELADTS